MNVLDIWRNPVDNNRHEARVWIMWRTDQPRIDVSDTRLFSSSPPNPVSLNTPQIPLILQYLPPSLKSFTHQSRALNISYWMIKTGSSSCSWSYSFLGATGTLCFRLRMILPVGFKARMDPSSPVLFCHLHVVISRAMSGCWDQASNPEFLAA